MKKSVLVTLVIALCFIPACTGSLPSYVKSLHYTEAMLDNWIIYGDAYIEWISLTDQPKPENDVWIDAITAQLSAMQLMHNKTIQLTPSSDMVYIHYNQCQYMKYLNEFVELETESIIYHDTDKRDQALAKKEIADTYYEALAASWDDFEATSY